jgi:hypothetical protein
MDLKPITTSQLHGRASVRGRALTVTDTDDNAVVRAALGKAARPFAAVVETAEGSWRFGN